MAAIFVDTGLKWILDQCTRDGNKLNLVGNLHLYKVDKVPAGGDLLADYTAIEANFTDYIAAAIPFAVAASIAGGVASIQADLHQWTKGVGGTGNLIYGWYLSDDTNNILIAAGDDPVKPIDMNTDNNTYSVQLTLSAARG